MDARWLFGMALLASTLPWVAGCGGGSGGGTGAKTAVITGSVLDLDSNPVRDARVYTIDNSTTTTNTGAYVLTGNRAGEVIVYAEYRKDGVWYRGQTWALLFDNEQSNNANIIVAAEDELGRVEGTVRDRSGNLLENVSVFAYSTAGSAQRAFTDSAGRYELRQLIGGVEYEIKAVGQGYRGDYDTIVVRSGDTRELNLVMGDPARPALTAPENLGVTTWVSPPESRQEAGRSPYEALKRIVDPTRADRPARRVRNDLRTDMLVEADLLWDEQRFADHLGWGIYRSTGAGTLRALDFMADPLAAYYVDLGLEPMSTYRYGVTTLSADYPEDPDRTESDLSDIVSAETLDLLELRPVETAPLTFRWDDASGADRFTIYVFNQFPGIGVDSIWNNENDRAAGTSYVYNGPRLQPGRTYHYMVLGSANGGDSYTISRVGTFVP